VRVPRVFSFLEDPEAAILGLQRLRNAAQSPATRCLNIDHQGCEVLGLCASVATDVTLIRARQTRKTKLRLEGTFPRDEAAQVMFRASGLPHQLGIRGADLPAHLEEQISRCELHHGKANRIDVDRCRDMAATDLTTYFATCLSRVGYGLSDVGSHGLSSLLAEVIGNAEEHGGPWYTIGFWRPHVVGPGAPPSGTCHLVIINFGKTIYESIASCRSGQLLSRLGSLTLNHSRRGLFRKGWDEEALWTLYALQDGVSRFWGTVRGRDRGNGTIRIIELFDQLAGANKKRMCIISGGAYILFDGRYGLSLAERDGEQVQTMAFNAANSLEIAPDPQCVRTLNGRFQGTIFSIKLTLEPEHLDRLAVSHEG
jgi:hypothetical protein